MNLLTLLLVLIVEQYVPGTTSRAQVQRWYGQYSSYWERYFNGGQYHHGVVAWSLAVLLPSILAGAIFFFADYYVHPLVAGLWNFVILYFMVGIRSFSHPYAKIMRALQSGDLEAARSHLNHWRSESPSKWATDIAGVELSSQEITKLAIEQGLQAAHSHVFGALFWFAILPGPVGLMLYRLTNLIAQHWRSASVTPLTDSEIVENHFDNFACWFFDVIDWLPARLTALSFAVVGDFEDAVYCWRTQAGNWYSQSLGVVLASGAGALGIRLGEPLRGFDGSPVDRPELGLGEQPGLEHMQSAIGLIWRTLIFWIFLLLFFVVLTG